MSINPLNGIGWRNCAATVHPGVVQNAIDSVSLAIRQYLRTQVIHNLFTATRAVWTKGSIERARVIFNREKVPRSLDFFKVHAP